MRAGSCRGRGRAIQQRPMRVLLLTPPMTQLNTPYPATAYLTGFLRQHEARLGAQVSQADPALELFLRLFSRAGLQRVLEELEGQAAAPPAPRSSGRVRRAPRRRAHGN